jgi:O-antigen/teichoic acid export membrane protein
MCLAFNMYYIPKLGNQGAVIAYLLSEVAEMVLSAGIVLIYRKKAAK